MTTSRNAACPCGSGLKFKRCCGVDGGKGVVQQPSDDADQTSASGGKLLPLVLFGLAVGIGVGVGTLRDAVADGLAVTFALAMASIIYLMARNPPEGTGKGGGTAINFGLDRRGNRRGSGPQNRRQRRRK